MNVSYSIRILIFTILLSACSSHFYAQGWVRSWGGTGTDISGRVTISGTDFVHAVTTTSYGAGQTDIMVVKTDSAGNLIWQQAIGTPAEETARGVVSAPTGEIYVAGDATGPGGKDIYLIKLDASGNILWTKNFPGPFYESASSIAISDSCIALSCDIANGGYYANKDITILGVDTAGNQLWSTSFGTPSGSDYASDIAPLHDGGFVIGGNTRPLSTQFGFLIRLNAGGDTVWTKTLPYDNNLSVGSCVQLQGDSLLAFGANWHTLVLRMNGDIKSNQENANGNTSGITSCSDGGYAIISSSNRVLQKYTHEGVQSWGKYIQYNNPYYLKQCIDGGFIISGYGDFCGSPSNLLIIKTDSGGNYNTYTGITPVISGNSYPVCPGDTVTISVPGGFDSYQWYQQYNTPTLLTGENDSVLQITGGGPNYHYYYCVLTRGVEQFITNVVNVTYLITWVPEISPSGPVNFCYPGNSITLEFNEANFHHYQWNLNGVPIPGASGDSYTPTVSGTYTVSAWRLCDTVVSEPVIVNTNAPPVASLNSYNSFITIISSTGAYCESSNPLTAPVVPGNSYQWLYNGNPTGGTTNQLYPGTPGSYQVITTNACGTDTSGIATHYENYLSIAIYSYGPVSGCGADTVVLQFSPWGYSNVQWYKNGIAISGANLDSLVVTTSGTYSCSMDVMCEFGNETATSNAVTVTVNPNPLPSISATGSTVVCSGTVLLTATPGGTGYAWYKNNQTIPGANSQTYLADSSGSYRCSVSSVACGNNRNTNTIIVKIGPPSEYITCSNTSICQGSTAYLYSYTTDYASSPTIRQWRKDGVPIAGANSSYYYADSQGSYDCELINLCDTSYTNAIFITVMSIPGISPSGNVSICAGDSITLNAATGTGYTYTWYNYNVISGAISSTYTTNQAGVYKVRVNTGSCNILSAPVIVTVNTLPVSNIWSSTPPVLCSNDSVWLHANNRPDYSHQWYLNNSPVANTASQIYASAGGSYTVQISDSNGCESISPEFMIYTNSIYVVPVSVNPNLPVCIGDSVTLSSGTTGISYQWLNNNSPIPGAVNASVSTGQQGMYSVMVTNSQGCTGTSSTYITISNPPVVSSYSGPSYCGNNNGYIALTLQGGTWPYAYQWSNGDTNSISSGLYSGDYTVTITDGAGCISVDTIPVPDLSNLNTQIYIQNDTLCAGDSTRLIAYGPAGSTFIWNTGASTNEFYTSTAGNYIVTVTDSTGCSGTDTVTVTLAPPINLLLTTTGASCSGATVNLDAGSGYSNYYWNIGANTQAINISSSGNYIVTVTDSNGCTSTDSTILQFSGPVTCTISGDTIVCSGNANALDAGSGFSSYLWNTGEITSSITPAITGIYSVVVTNTAGCTGTDSIAVIVNPSPVVFVTASGPVVFCAGNSVTLDAGPGFSSYQWYNYSYPLILQTSQTFTAAGSGKYSCVVSNASTCIDTSNFIMVRVPCISLDPPVDRSLGASDNEFNLTIYPVPANEILNISFYNYHNLSVSIPVTITDINGRIIFENNITGSQGWNEHPIDVNKFPPGIYFLSLKFQERNFIRKVAVE